MILPSAQGYLFQEWLRSKVRSSVDTPVFPRNKEDINSYHKSVRKFFESATGPVPQYDPLQAEIHQVHKRDGYRIEAVSFPTFAGLRMTGTAYVPDSNAPVPGVLAVHGHSMHGRRDARTQIQCAALAKLGYFVLAVDAFGNGERSVAIPGEYHGGLYAVALWLTGYSLFGVQIHENFRACDYLASRPEVDSTRLGITGASGGGNQSFYSGAWDNRFKAVVPVCSTGSYYKLVSSVNCMCETPFALANKLEQYDIFSLTAPRSLLVMSAKSDAFSFRYEDARETIKKAREIWKMLDCSEKIAFDPLPIKHGYPLIARERCIQWFNRHLKGIEDTKVIKEPPVNVESYDTISCYPTAVVSQVMTMPEFFDKKREEVLPQNKQVTAESVSKIFSYNEKIKLEMDNLSGTKFVRENSPAVATVFKGKDGTLVSALCHWPDLNFKADEILIIVSDNKEEISQKPVCQMALVNNIAVWAVDLPGLGEGRLRGEYVGSITSLRACYMLGFPLTGYWLSLIQSIVDIAKKEASNVYLYATEGPATAVLVGSSLLEGVDKLVVENPLASYNGTNVFTNIPSEALIQNILTEGDIPDFAALRAPNNLSIITPIAGNGEKLSIPEMNQIFLPITDRYTSLGRRDNLRLIGEGEAKSTLSGESGFKKCF